MQDAERLATMAVEDGIATFILASDEAAGIRRFGEEVAPEVRSLVADHRAAR